MVGAEPFRKRRGTSSNGQIDAMALETGAGRWRSGRKYAVFSPGFRSGIEFPQFEYSNCHNTVTICPSRVIMWRSRLLLSLTTMPRLSTRRDLRRPQPFLLLWMLPYFVFSVWASPFHLHTPDGREMSMSALAEVVSGSRSPSHTQHKIEKTSDTKDAGDCFLCDWNAHASALLVSAAFVRPSVRTRLVSPAAPKFLLSRFTRNTRNRGPPRSS